MKLFYMKEMYYFKHLNSVRRLAATLISGREHIQKYSSHWVQDSLIVCNKYHVLRQASKIINFWSFLNSSAIINLAANLGSARAEVSELCALTLSAIIVWAKRIL